MHDEREEREWFRTAWLAAHIGPMVWANRTHTPYELLGRPNPHQEQQVRAFWSAIKDRQEQGH